MTSTVPTAASVQCESIVLERPGPARRVPWLALVGLFVVVVASAAGMPAWLRWPLLVALGAAWWRFVERAPAAPAGTLSLEGDGIRVERGLGTERVALAEIDRVVVGPLLDGNARLTIMLGEGAISAVARPEQAGAFRAILRGRVSPRPAEVPWRLPSERVQLQRILFFLMMAISILLSAIVAFQAAPMTNPGAPWGAAAAALTMITLMLLPTQALQTKIIAGPNGFHARAAGTTSELSFIPFADVASVTIERRLLGRGGYAQIVVIAQKTGPGISLPFWERTYGAERTIEMAETVAAIAREG